MITAWTRMLRFYLYEDLAAECRRGAAQWIKRPFEPKMFPAIVLLRSMFCWLFATQKTQNFEIYIYPGSDIYLYALRFYRNREIILDINRTAKGVAVGPGRPASITIWLFHAAVIAVPFPLHSRNIRTWLISHNSFRDESKDYISPEVLCINFRHRHASQTLDSDYKCFMVAFSNTPFDGHINIQRVMR